MGVTTQQFASLFDAMGGLSPGPGRRLTEGIDLAWRTNLARVNRITAECAGAKCRALSDRRR
jgi:hypothetical protein